MLFRLLCNNCVLCLLTKRGKKRYNLQLMSNLSWPYTYETRHVAISDGVLFLPDLLDDYDQFIFPAWEEIFNNSNPIAIEYCSGNGAWIVEKALENPGINFVAVEKKFDRVRKIHGRMRRMGVTNLFIVYGEGLRFTKEYVKQGSVEQVYINFPDPWPKRRHWDNRIMQGVFLLEMQRILRKGAQLTFVTDDEPYSEAVLKEISKHPAFKPLFPLPHYVHELAGYGSSYFEELWRSKGLKIRYHRFEKCN